MARPNLGTRVRNAVGWSTELAVRAFNAIKYSTATQWLISPPGAFIQRRGVQDWLNAYSASPWIRGIVSGITRRMAAQAFEIFTPDRSATVKRRILAGPCSVNRSMTGEALTLDDIATATIVRDAGQVTPSAPIYWRGLSTRMVPGTIINHPARALLDRPNPDMSWSDLCHVTGCHMELAGNAYWIKERLPNGEPGALFPIQPHFCRRAPTPREPFFLFVFWGYMCWIPREDVVWFRDFDPENPYGFGVSVAMSVEDEAAADEKASKLQARFFDNDATPRLILQYEGDMTEGQVQAIRAQWNEKYRGVWNQFKPAILAGTLKDIKTVSSSMRDMEFSKLRDWNMKVFRGAWQMAGVLLGQMEDANRANAEAALYQFALAVLSPRLISMQQVVTRDLLGDVAWAKKFPGCWMEFHDPVERDRERDTAIADRAWNSGAIILNEYRDTLDLEPVACGGVYKVANIEATAYVTDLRKLPTPPPPPAPAKQPALPEPGKPQLALPAPKPPKPAPDDDAADQDEDDGEDDAENDGGGGKKPKPPKPPKATGRTILPVRSEKMESYALRAQQERTEALEPAFLEMLDHLWAMQEEGVLRRLNERHKLFGDRITRAEGDDADEEAEFWLGPADAWHNEWDPIFAAAARKQLEAAAQAGGQQAMVLAAVVLHTDQIGRFDLLNPRVLEVLAARSQRFAVPVNETTWERLKDSFAEGIKNGEPLRAMRGRVTDTMRLRKNQSAATIARTETNGMYNAAAHEGYRQSGVEYKAWVTSEDDRVRPAHFDLGIEYDRANAIPLDQAFEYDGEEAMQPGDFPSAGLSINCRCTVVPTRAPQKTRDYNPDQPRDPDGKWGSGGSAAGYDKENGGWVDAAGNHDPRVHAALEEIKVPHDAKNVRLQIRNGDELKATFREPGAKKQTDLYNAVHWQLATAVKTERLADFEQALPTIREQALKDSESGTGRAKENADVVRVMDATGMRVGGPDSESKGAPTFGVTTLRGEHVHIDGNKVTFDFTGKSAVHYVKEIEDPALAKMIGNRIKQAGQGGMLFDTTADSSRSYIRKASGNEDFKNHDFRTAHANRVAAREIASRPVPTNAKEYAKARNAIGDIVAHELQDTRATVLKNYILPGQFSHWETAVTGGTKAAAPLQRSADAGNALDGKRKVGCYGFTAGDIGDPELLDLFNFVGYTGVIPRWEDVAWSDDDPEDPATQVGKPGGSDVFAP